MPTRYIKESINTSPNLGRVSHGAARMFFHLIPRADDFGRFIAEADVIRGNCFSKVPSVTLQDIIGWKKELAQNHLVRYYRVNGREYGVFLTWQDHQGKPRAKESKYPQPPAPAGIRRQLRAIAGTRGHPPTDSPGIRSSYSSNRNRSSSSISEVRDGPQPIGSVIKRTAEDLERRA